MKRKHFFVIIVIILVIYYFLFPPATGKELVLSLDGRLALSGTGLSESKGRLAPDQLLVFESDNFYGLVSADLSAIHWNEKTDNPVALSSRGILEKKLDSGTIQGRDAQGNLLFEVKAPGKYPFYRGGRVFFASQDGLYLEERSALGAKLWGREFDTPVTSLSAGQKTLLAGELSGEWQLLDVKGNRLVSERPGGSRIEVIYGTALSAQEDRVAVISGLDPQRLVLYEGNQREGFRPRFHCEMETPFRRPLRMGFSAKGDLLYWEGSGGVHLLNTDKPTPRKVRFIPLPGELQKVTLLSERPLLAIMTQGKGHGWITLLDQHDNVFLEKKLPGDADQYQWKDHSLYGVLENYIYRWSLTLLPQGGSAP